MIPRATSTATWPSPRCSRNVVAACHRARWGSSGRGSTWFAAASTRPAQSAAVAACQARSAASAVSGAATRASPHSRRSAASAPESRAASAAAGVVRAQASGSARAIRSGWNPKNAAVATCALTAPSGATRSAVYPIQKPRMPSASAAARASSVK